MTQSRTYRLFYVPPACSTYQVGDDVDFMVPVPAPAVWTVVSDDDDNGTKGNLLPE